MAKEPMTPEQRAKAAENLARARAIQRANKIAAENEAKRVEEQLAKETAPEPTVNEQAPLTPTEMLLQRLMAEIDELKKQRNPNSTPDQNLQYLAQQQGIQLGAKGIQGRQFKYPIEESYYPNPVERLYDEPRLSRFNLRENYFFDWKVTGVEYEKYGVTYAEPKFTVRIFRRMYGDDGQPSGEMALINTSIMHEDEIVARSAADKLGITEEFDDMRALMDEVRYFRVRQWLLDLFTPPHVDTYQRRPRTMVVDGKVVEMFDTESLIDGDSGISKANSVRGSQRI